MDKAGSGARICGRVRVTPALKTAAVDAMQLGSVLKKPKAPLVPRASTERPAETKGPDAFLGRGMHRTSCVAQLTAITSNLMSHRFRARWAGS